MTPWGMECEWYVCMYKTKLIMVQQFSELLIILIDGRFGVVVGILAYYARGRGFDCCTVQTFVCMNMSVYIGSGCFYVQYVCIYKKNVLKFILMRYLESITQAS
jgi:hypothetical protein